MCECRLEYATDLFSALAAARMAGHLTELLHSIAEDPERSIGRLNLMRAEERRQIVEGWNQTRRNYPRDRCVHQLVEEQARRTPDAVAMECADESLTYAELNARANRLAHHLRSLGVGPDVPVGLCPGRSLEMGVALLGILKAGGAYVPLDPALPRKRLALMIDDAACKVVIAHDVSTLSLPANLNARGTTPVLLTCDAIASGVDPGGGRDPDPIASPDHLAYVMYTSGSTGEPKGVEMPHRALVNLVHWQGSVSAMGCGARTLQFASLGFDVSFQEIFSTWASGARWSWSPMMFAETRPRSWRRSPARIDRIFLPVVMLERLAEAAVNQDVLPKDLKEVSVAGEQLRIGSAVRSLFDRMPGCRLWNHYGPTEAHVVTSFELLGAPSSWPDVPSIGQPLPNCRVYLLDAQHDPVPPGVVGELWIGGICLSRGYRHRPELTSDRFIPDPFDRGPGPACTEPVTLRGGGRMARSSSLAARINRSRSGVSRGTGRDRDRPRRSSLDRLLRRDRTRAGREKQITCGLRGPGRSNIALRRVVTRVAGREIARVHDSVSVRRAGRLAVDTQWQG